MSLRTCPLALLPVLVAACLRTDAVPEALGTACPITAPAQVVAAPPGFVGDPDVWYGLYAFGDHVLFTFDPLDDPERVYWRYDRCTGALAPYPSLAPGLHNPYSIQTPAGRVLYANDALGKPYLVDRLDQPGDDEARPVPGVPEDTEPLLFTGIDQPTPFTAYWISRGDGIYGAAGLGGNTRAMYIHDGDPERPAVKLGDAVVAFTPAGDDLGGPYYLHLDSGELHRVDPRTGEGELLLSGVRHLTSLGGLDRLIWQEIGDDVAETIYLRDLGTGEDMPIAVNDFAQKSWFRDLDRLRLGRLVAVADGAVAALPGPDGPLVAAVRTDTGASIELPEHLDIEGARGDAFDLVLAREPELVRALWRPLTGELSEWYRGGPEEELDLLRVDGDTLEYLVRVPGGLDGALWRVDLGSGARERLLAYADRFPTRLDDDHYFLALARRSLPGPPRDGSSYTSAGAYDLKLAEALTNLYTPIADDVTAYAWIAGEGLVYLAPRGEAPGVYVHPLP